MTKYVLICAGDWEGLYVDGILSMERHSISAADMLYYTNMGDVIYLTPAQDKELCERGSLPLHLVDVDKLCPKPTNEND